MTPSCLRGAGLPLAGVIALAACRASVPGAAPASGAPTAASSGFAVARYAESVPITALAVGAPYVWAGTEHGLRRWKIGAVGAGAGAGVDADADVDAEPIGTEQGLPGHRIDALAVDDERGVWVATEAGIGRLAEKAGRLRYEARGTVAAAAAAASSSSSSPSPPSSPPSSPPITRLAPTRDGGGAWAAGAGGLYHGDGQGWTPIELLRDVAVTSLDLDDDDGRSVWVGTRGRGLFFVDGSSARQILDPGVGAGVDVATEEIVGTARTAGGARVVAVRAGDGGRITLVTRSGTEEYRTQPGAGARFVRLVAVGARAILIAGAAGAEQAYDLRPLPRGESPATGGFRLVAARKGSAARYQALPLALAVPPEPTVVVAGGGGDGGSAPVIWFGSRVMGVARAGTVRPFYLSGDLTDDTDRLSVACSAVDGCLVVAGGTHAWFFDGARFHETRVGESAAGRALAVVQERGGVIYGVISEPPFQGVAVTRLGPGVAGEPRAGDWQVVEKVPLTALGTPAANRPAISFAVFAPGGNLWLGLGAVATDGDGQEQGRGALEISLALAPAAGSKSAAVIHHGGPSAKEASAEALPLSHDLTAVLFDGSATWFASRSGIDRLQEAELRHWGENEHLDSEVCLDVVKGTDGKIWAATSAGVGRFDGTEWRFASEGDAPVATRALANDGGGHMWIATAKGLRVLGETAASAARLGAGARIVDDDILDLTLDRFGRVWALGAAALAVVDTRGAPSSSSSTAGGTR